MPTALMPRLFGYLPCGCERTAGTCAAAIAIATTAQAAPTVKARAKSWLPRWAVTRPAPAALDRTATPAAPPSSWNVLTSADRDRKSTRLNSSHRCISYAVFCLKKKNKHIGTNKRDTERESNDGQN